MENRLHIEVATDKEARAFVVGKNANFNVSGKITSVSAPSTFENIDGEEVDSPGSVTIEITKLKRLGKRDDAQDAFDFIESGED